MHTLKLMIVDDHALVRMGLKTSLEMEVDFRVVNEASNGEQAIARYFEVRPDITLMDLRLPGLNAIETTVRLREQDPQAKVIVISTFNGSEDIYRAMQAGAKTFLPKSVQREEMIAAIRAIADGKTYFPASVASRLAERMQRKSLSPRELAVLKLLVDGETNKEIASALSLAEVTVKLHVGNILEKLGARDRTEAARLAIERGLIWLD